MKEHRTFPVRQRLFVENFDLVKHTRKFPGEPSKATATYWTLNLGGAAIFELPDDTAYSEVQARKLFQWMLNIRAAAIFTGIDEGAETLRSELRNLLHVAAVPKGT